MHIVKICFDLTAKLVNGIKSNYNKNNSISLMVELLDYILEFTCLSSLRATRSFSGRNFRAHGNSWCAQSDPDTRVIKKICTSVNCDCWRVHDFVFSDLSSLLNIVKQMDKASWLLRMIGLLNCGQAVPLQKRSWWMWIEVNCLSSSTLAGR